jgi:hypothetical protein
MRLLLFLLGVFVAVICAEKPAAAQDGGWCAYYIFDRAGSQHQQCLAAVSGGFAGTADPVRTTSRRTTNDIDGAIGIDSATASAVVPAV